MNKSLNDFINQILKYRNFFELKEEVFKFVLKGKLLKGLHSQNITVELDVEYLCEINVVTKQIKILREN